MGKSSPNYGPQPVATKLPNPYGLYDIAGNASEASGTFSFGDGAEVFPDNIFENFVVSAYSKGGSWIGDPLSFPPSAHAVSFAIQGGTMELGFRLVRKP